MPDPVVRTYDFKNYANVWGPILFTGEAEEGITIVRPEDMFGAKTGAGGDRERANLGNFHLEITVNVLKTNPINDRLSALFNADALFNTSKLPWFTKDLKGTSLVSCLHAWLRKDADMTLNREGDMNIWIFDTGPATKFTGGTII
jgi:hypothetical protein